MHFVSFETKKQTFDKNHKKKKKKKKPTEKSEKKNPLNYSTSMSQVIKIFRQNHNEFCLFGVRKGKKKKKR